MGRADPCGRAWGHPSPLETPSDFERGCDFLGVFTQRAVTSPSVSFPLHVPPTSTSSAPLREIHQHWLPSRCLCVSLGDGNREERKEGGDISQHPAIAPKPLSPDSATKLGLVSTCTKTSLCTTSHPRGTTPSGAHQPELQREQAEVAAPPSQGPEPGKGAGWDQDPRSAMNYSRGGATEPRPSEDLPVNSRDGDDLQLGPAQRAACLLQMDPSEPAQVLPSTN